jgi:uncharacterized oxidoreductase
MKISGNTILITGGGSGIGRALAEAFHKLGNKVIISGRRRSVLEETVAANPGMEALSVDMENAESIRSFAAEAIAKFPGLNAVIHNAGIMRPENVFDEKAVADAEATITTNVLGPIRLTAALLPHLEKKANATIITVTSGLAFLPLALTPTYNATKAAIHSYTQSLRFQLKSKGIQVIELPPPYVQTELMGSGQASDPRAMPLAEFIAEVMKLLETQPEADEILVERVKPLRFAEQGGPEKYKAFFEDFNNAMMHPQ